jgi:hypothetical protein
MARTVTVAITNKIRPYWREHEKNKYFNVDWDNTEKTCFACGLDCKTIDKAHIKPKRFFNSAEEANTPSNLHLLCRVCHTNSEMLSGDAYWEWMKLSSMCYTEGTIKLKNVCKTYRGFIAITCLSQLESYSRIECAQRDNEQTIGVEWIRGEEE